MTTKANMWCEHPYTPRQRAAHVAQFTPSLKLTLKQKIVRIIRYQERWVPRLN